MCTFHIAHKRVVISFSFFFPFFIPTLVSCFSSKNDVTKKVEPVLMTI